MTPEEIRLRRLANQHLLSPTLTDPAAVVAALGAVQAQEYAMAKWAIALRLKETHGDAEIEAAFDAGRILRAHLLRPTWHFATREDYRMVLRATADRVQQANAHMYRRTGLDSTRRDRFAGLVRELLAGGVCLTREEIRAAVPDELVGGETFSMAYQLMNAELEGVVCSGPRRGNQFTYALLDERVPEPYRMSVEEAQVAIVRRYLAARGPATVADLTTWSGLTVAQARAALGTLDEQVTRVESDGRTYLLLAGSDEVPTWRPTAFLLPDYDEYGMGYKDRSALAHPEQGYWLPWNRPVIVDGVIAGAWQRRASATSVRVEVRLFDLAAGDSRVVEAAAAYASFLDLDLELVFV